MGVFQRISFSWINGIVRKARRGKLQDKHLPLPDDQMAELNFEAFTHEWELELQREKDAKNPPSLLKALWRQNGREFMIAGFFKLMWSFFVIMGAFFFVRSLLLFVDPDKPSVYDSDTAGYLLMAFFFVDAWLLGLSLQRMGDICLRVGIKIRAALVSAVAKKAFTMASVTQELSADIISFVASDIHKVYDGIQQIHYLWTAPLEALTILSLLCSLTKQYAIPGFAIVGLIMPLQYYFGYLTTKAKYANAKNAAARVALAQEVLPSMKLVKYYCWERFFVDELSRIRKQEIPTQWKLLYIRATNIAIVFTTPPLTAFTIFTAYEFGVGKLISDIAFTTLSLFNIMRFPLVVLPKAIRSAAEGYASLQRVEKFLLLPIEHHENKPSANKAPGAFIHNATFTYKMAKDDFSLHIPHFEVKPGEVVGIAGKVGSGKTSVVNAILGHIEVNSGTVNVSGSMSYVRQMAWLQNIACRDNITFGERFEQAKYDEIIHACALELDFQILANGDMTKAGLRGVNLSGGQRQRVNIARAAYSEADIMILDSPLSAVDYHTAHHIFKYCIKFLFREKAVVLVTHSLDILPQCDKIAIMDGGHMVYFGPFTMEAINKHMPSDVNKILEEAANNLVDDPASPKNGPRKSVALSRPPPIPKHMEKVNIPGEEASAKVGYRIPMVKSMGKYWIQGGMVIGFISLFFYIIAQSSRQMSDYWIRQWVNDTLKLYKNRFENVGGEVKKFPIHGARGSQVYALTYMALMLAFATFNWLRGYYFFSWTNAAANRFFKKYVARTFDAPLAFFFNNPVGDLINVYSKDQDIVDENLPEALHFTGIYGLILLATVVTVSTVIKLFSIFGGILLLVSGLALLQYLPAATQLKWLTADSSSELTTLVSEALEGLDVLQAYHKQPYFIQEAEKRLNTYHRHYFNSESLNLWLAFYCDMFGAILVLAVACFAVFQKEELGAANVGLAFSNVIQMLVFYTWVIRFLADTISFWGSTERISGLALNTPSESDIKPVGSDGKLAITVSNGDFIPRTGIVEFQNVWMRYRHNLPWALKGCSFKILDKEKIGVVGRTGSGKSTLLLALYRMFELGAGNIVYDGVDINTITREKLRLGLSIIPQEPLMFSGSLRHNMDPYDEKTDKELWDALEKVGLKEQAEHMHGGLAAIIDGSSAEWSLGQKQLLCLARAALTHVPVLCLDEATAAMDPSTEQLVLKTIDTLFVNRTTITIAHRLDVVIECDRILALDQGEVVEFDSPDELLSKPKSLFCQLVDRCGPTQAGALRIMARSATVAKGRPIPVGESSSR
jgi:ATP-binding cassette, subfamily C (CFTR/MRP), member 1